MFESAELNREKAAQLENFINLLVELAIIEPSKVKGGENNHTSNQSDKNLSSFDMLASEIGNELECIKRESKFTQVDNKYCSSTIYLEAKLDSEPALVKLPSYQENVEEIAVEITSFEPQPKKTNQINTDSSEDKLAAFQKLQDILVGNDLAQIKESLNKLNHQIYDSDELPKLFLPQITELLRRKISESKLEVVEAITPFIDNAIHTRVEQDKESMGTALAAAVPVAIAEQIRINREEVAAAIAPVMGEAIQKQIALEQDKIVDALYPVIGNTITKYMGETIQAINEQIENTLSFGGIQRKIRAKIQGVSEAELIVKESISFTAQAIFLIHKESGLIICDIQPPDAEKLESDMIAGMLTAIRSFANDCMAQSGNVSELDEIDYGNFKIILEVAGYCYLAIIVKGEVPKKFISKMRRTLSKIIINYGKYIENFEGDLEIIPNQINRLLENLKNYNYQNKNNKNQPSSIFILSLAILGIIFIPWGIWQYRSHIISSIENKTALALSSEPELSIYRLDATIDGEKLKLTGRVPNQYLKTKAKQIVISTVPNWKIENQIIAVEVPASPVFAQAEVKRTTNILNHTINGAVIVANYSDGKVSIEGNVSKIIDTKIINQAFAKIPGVKIVSSTVQVKPFSIPVRFYFENESSNLVPKDFDTKVKQVKIFLRKYPMNNINIIGYSYSKKENSATKDLAIKRAKSVQQALIKQGISPSRLQIDGKTSLPPGIDETQPLWLMRCVILELISKQ